MASSERCPHSTRIVQILPIVFALLTAGCYKAMGGGWIQPAPLYGGDRATFGFNVQCRDTRDRGMPVAVLSSGQLDWHDGNVSFHGDVEPVAVPGQICQNITMVNLQTITFTGTYTPQPSGMGGTFTSRVFDGGEPGAISHDYIDIQLVGGYYNGYANAGVIQEGNIQVY